MAKTCTCKQKERLIPQVRVISGSTDPPLTKQSGATREGAPPRCRTSRIEPRMAGRLFTCWTSTHCTQLIPTMQPYDRRGDTAVVRRNTSPKYATLPFKIVEVYISHHNKAQSVIERLHKRRRYQFLHTSEWTIRAKFPQPQVGIVRVTQPAGEVRAS